jgi:hypothetical protein
MSVFCDILICQSAIFTDITQEKLKMSKGGLTGAALTMGPALMMTNMMQR